MKDENPMWNITKAELDEIRDAKFIGLNLSQRDKDILEYYGEVEQYGF